MKMTFPEIRIIATGPWTTYTASSATFLDLYLELDDSDQLSTTIYDKRDDFNIKIINFPNMCSWYADDLLKQCLFKGDKYVIDEELQHTDHLFPIVLILLICCVGIFALISKFS
jgi:hypothetical protein